MANSILPMDGSRESHKADQGSGKRYIYLMRSVALDGVAHREERALTVMALFEGLGSVSAFRPESNCHTPSVGFRKQRPSNRFG